MSNIFELWRHNGELLPFGARRDSWAETTHVLVEEVVLRRWPYGDAFGFVYVNGAKQAPLNPTTPFSPRGVPDISCAGSFQWSFVALPGCPIGEPIIPKTRKARIKKIRILQQGDLIGFGKYRADAIEKILHANPAWIKWALLNVEHFAFDPDLWEATTSTDPEMRPGGKARVINQTRVKGVTP